MNRPIKKLLNFVKYLSWTDCDHPLWKPVGIVDWYCVNCGTTTEGYNPNNLPTDGRKNK